MRVTCRVVRHELKIERTSREEASTDTKEGRLEKKKIGQVPSESIFN